MKYTYSVLFAVLTFASCQKVQQEAASEKPTEEVQEEMLLLTECLWSAPPHTIKLDPLYKK